MKRTTKLYYLYYLPGYDPFILKVSVTLWASKGTTPGKVLKSLATGMDVGFCDALINRAIFHILHSKINRKMRKKLINTFNRINGKRAAVSLQKTALSALEGYPL